MPSPQSSLTLSAILLSSLTLRAQAPPATPTAPATPAARAAAAPPSVVAGIPVNYDESKVGTYTLADPLKLNDGKPVKNAKTWNEKRRPEILKIFDTQQYGSHARPPRRRELRSH